jgi:hypothetical protein
MSPDDIIKNVPVELRSVRIHENELKRLQRFGVAGESVNDALKRVLTVAEKYRDEIKL